MGWGGGGSADFIFMGAGIFLKSGDSLESANRFARIGPSKVGFTKTTCSEHARQKVIAIDSMTDVAKNLGARFCHGLNDPFRDGFRDDGISQHFTCGVVRERGHCRNISAKFLRNFGTFRRISARVSSRNKPLFG